MAVRLGSSAPVGLSRERFLRFAASGARQPVVWTRPADWVAFTTPTSAEQKVIGNVAVYNQDSNYIALACTVTGGYTVDWGDGTSTTHTSADTAEKNYTYSSLDSGTLSSRGYRQAVITVTPTTGGATFSAVNLNRRHSAISSNSTTATNPWLDIAIAAPNATTVEFSYLSAGTRTSSMSLCEQVTIVAHNTTTMANKFREFRQLQSVPLFNTAAVTNMTQMFFGCSSLQSVPLFNTAAVTTMSGMLSGCSSLQSVPLFNTAAVTTMQTMFNGCSSLQSVPLFNTASVTAMSNMFSGCSSLQSVPLFNTAAVTGMGTMFSGCSSLQSVPLFNTAAVTSMSSMFNDCFSLQTVPLFNTAAVTTMQSMFSGCSSLQTVPLFNTASVTAIAQMFNSCLSLQNIPELNLTKISSVTNNNMNLGAGTSLVVANLGQAKLTGNRWTQTFQNCKMGVTQLDEMYTALATLNPNVTNVTAAAGVVTYTVDDIRAFVAARTVTITGVNPVAYNLTSVTVGVVTAGAGTTGTFTVTNAATGAYVSGGVAALQDNRTITVTSNPGVSGDNPTIATNKGWIVTG